MIKVFLKNLVLPVSQDEDEARREFILNVLLVAVVGLSLAAFVVNLFRIIFGLTNEIPASITFATLSFIILSFFVFLYFLSRRGYSLFASYALLVIFFLPVTYSAYKYGVDLPSVLLLYALIIVMAGVLISTHFAFLITTVVVVAMLLMGYAEHAGLLEVDRYWRNEAWIFADLIFIFVIFSIIATVSWLSNREIEKSLTRARRSEADLKKERDSLEVTVEARTRELKETQAEKMTQLYRFAEFGRLSSGLFHDLINPLTAVSLNIEKIKDLEQNIDPHIEFAIQNTDITPISETAAYIDKAILAARKMEDMVIAVRKQLSREETKTLFSVNEEIGQAIDVLSHKAMKACVEMRFQNGNEINTYGDSVKFNQVALNLIANAIDAHQDLHINKDERKVTVALDKKDNIIIFEVKDKGIGILEENKLKLFEPFFTTKVEGHGMGIGLSITKRIIEKDFDGIISVKSKDGDGSTFTVKFPQKQNE